MMERLSERLREILNEQDFCFDLHEMNDVQRALIRLAAYEDMGLTSEEIKTFYKAISELSGELAKYKEAEEQGRLIVLPCKVGSTVYKITRHRVDVSGYRMEWEFETMIEPVKFTIGMIGAIGKTVFLTREEAEAALEETYNGE